MKKRIIQFLTTYFLFVLLFVLQKPIFMVYYHDLYTNVSLGDYFRVMWHGLPLDLSLAGYLTAIPGLLLIASAWTNSSILRRIRQGYFGVIAFIMACIFIIDLGLYGFWGFRLDATPVFYFFSSPKDAMASVSFWFVLLGILSMLIYAAILYFIFYCVLIREKKPLKIPYRRQNVSLALLLLTAALFIPIRGGFSVSTMNLSKVYFSQDQRMNHAAINPAFSFMYSATHQNNFDKQYRFIASFCIIRRIRSAVPLIRRRDESASREDRRGGYGIYPPRSRPVCANGFTCRYPERARYKRSYPSDRARAWPERSSRAKPSSAPR